MTWGPVLIAGAGAIGSVFAGMLAKSGEAVTMLGRKAHLDRIAREGLELSGLSGEHRVDGMELVDDPRRLEQAFGLVLCTVKSYDTATMADAIAGHVADDCLVVSVQNGLGNIETLAERLGPARVIGARVIFGAELVDSGKVRVTVFAEPVAVGPTPAINGAATAGLRFRAAALAEGLSRCGIPTRACADIMPVLWAKLLYNAALNPLGALLGLHYGALGDDPDLRAIMDDTIEEAFAVAQRANVTLPFPDAASYRQFFYQKLLPRTLNHRPSMLYDLERRGRTEIGALNGKLVELGERLGVETPNNRMLTRLIHARERMQQRSIWRAQ